MTRLTEQKGGYVRPEKTFQEALTTDEIKEKLRDYKKVDDISTVPLNTQVRYFVYKNDPVKQKTERLFRLGGKLINKEHYTKYVVVGNGKHTWSVNTTTAVFWREKSINEIKQEYEEKIQRLKEKINILKR